MVPYLSSNRLPVLEVHPGKFVFSTNASAQLLLGASEEGNQSAVDQWLDWEAASLYVSTDGYQELW